MPHAGRLRKNVGIATMYVGHILDANQAENILANRYADLIGVARELLYNPNWLLHARKALLNDGFDCWPQQYGWCLDRRALVPEAVRENASSDRPSSSS